MCPSISLVPLKDKNFGEVLKKHSLPMNKTENEYAVGKSRPSFYEISCVLLMENAKFSSIGPTG